MLVLTRYVGESICIGDSIEVKVLRRRGKRTILGISAPQDISVHRKEIYLSFSALKKALTSQEELDLPGK